MPSDSRSPSSTVIEGPGGFGALVIRRDSFARGGPWGYRVSQAALVPDGTGVIV